MLILLVIRCSLCFISLVAARTWVPRQQPCALLLHAAPAHSSPCRRLCCLLLAGGSCFLWWPHALLHVGCALSFSSAVARPSSPSCDMARVASTSLSGARSSSVTAAAVIADAREDAKCSGQRTPSIF
jgi:hypothetical protein